MVHNYVLTTVVFKALNVSTLAKHFCHVDLCIPASVHEIFPALMWPLLDEQATSKTSTLMSVTLRQ